VSNKTNMASNSQHVDDQRPGAAPAGHSFDDESVADPDEFKDSQRQALELSLKDYTSNPPAACDHGDVSDGLLVLQVSLPWLGPLFGHRGGESRNGWRNVRAHRRRRQRA